MNAEEIKQRLEKLSQAENGGDDDGGVLPAALLRLVESNEKIAERIDALEDAQKKAGKLSATKLETVERALSAQSKAGKSFSGELNLTRKDLAGLQTAQKKAGDLSAAKLESVERGLRSGVKVVLTTIVVATIIAIALDR